VPESVTDRIPLVGADGFSAAWNRRQRLAQEAGLHVERVAHLLRRYGTRVTELLDLIDGDHTLASPIPGADDYLAVEALYAASHEGALHVDDVLTRRTRVSIEMFDRGLTAAQPVAALMARVLGWDDDTVRREVEHYHLRVAAERDSQTQADDRTADAARLGAPDVRMGSVSD
jgi:glycerol-3-phosphate dehydrogenase